MTDRTCFIGTAAQLAGASVKAIRLYESLGLLPPAPRRGRYRVYDNAAIERIRLIKCAQLLGFTLRELDRVLGRSRESLPLSTVIRELERKRRALDAEIDTLTRLRSELVQFQTALEQGQPWYGVAAPPVVVPAAPCPLQPQAARIALA